MRVFSISGFSGTGKTTLVESIVRNLVSQRYTVITIKSSQHEPKAGIQTDTWMHKQAGAIESHFRGLANREKSLKEIVGSVTSDFLIVEGMKASPIPKFWCIGDSQVGDAIPTDVKAIISWDASCVEDYQGIPVLNPDNIEQLVSIIMKEAKELDSLDI